MTVAAPSAPSKFGIYRVPGVSVPTLTLNVRRDIGGCLPLRSGLNVPAAFEKLGISEAEKPMIAGITDDGVDYEVLRRTMRDLRGVYGQRAIVGLNDSRVLLFRKLFQPIESEGFEAVTRGIIAQICDPEKIYGDFNLAATINSGISYQDMKITSPRLAEYRTITGLYLDFLQYPVPFLIGQALGTVWQGTFQTKWTRLMQQKPSDEDKNRFREVMFSFISGTIGEILYKWTSSAELLSTSRLVEFLASHSNYQYVDGKLEVDGSMTEAERDELIKCVGLKQKEIIEALFEKSQTLEEPINKRMQVLAGVVSRLMFHYDEMEMFYRMAASLYDISDLDLMSADGQKAIRHLTHIMQGQAVRRPDWDASTGLRLITRFAAPLVAAQREDLEGLAGQIISLSQSCEEVSKGGRVFFQETPGEYVPVCLASLVRENSRTQKQIYLEEEIELLITMLKLANIPLSEAIAHLLVLEP